MSSEAPHEGDADPSGDAESAVLETAIEAERCTALARERIALDAFTAFVAQANVDHYDALALLR